MCKRLLDVFDVGDQSFEDKCNVFERGEELGELGSFVFLLRCIFYFQSDWMLMR